MSIDSGKKPPDELDLLVGSTVLGKYHIDRLIGRGGMGAVFQATNAAIGKRVALKFLGANTSRDSEATVRFQREAEAASLAESPHIVQIFDSGRSEQGLPFLVMELLTGEDLRARIRRETKLELSAALRVIAQVLKALKQAHAAGIVHRDLKPDNVFLCRRDGEPDFVKLVDFGISKLQQRPGVDTLTHEGAVLGTAFYMSPEQAQSFPDIDGRTDLFSVGAIFYEMLTGEPPHTAPTYEAVLIAICTREAPDVRRKAPEVPDEVARIIARALQRERGERYQSADDMLEELDDAQREGRALAAQTRAARRERPPGAIAKPERYRTLVLAIVAALGGFAVAAYFVTRGESPVAESPAAPSAAGPVPARASPNLPSAPNETSSPASPPEPAASLSARPAVRALPPRTTDPGRSALKKARPAGSAGVAGSLGLSTREP